METSPAATQQTSTHTLGPGKVVWAKVEGHDWWPARVVRYIHSSHAHSLHLLCCSELKALFTFAGPPAILIIAAHRANPP